MPYMVDIWKGILMSSPPDAYYNIDRSWPVCVDDFNQDIGPGAIKAVVTQTETCCICGKTTTDGIYYRGDPNNVFYPPEAVPSKKEE